MEVLVFLVPLALLLGFVGLIGFLWSLRNGQYDDLEGAGWRAIADDDPVRDSSVESIESPLRAAGPQVDSDRDDQDEREQRRHDLHRIDAL